MAIQSLASIVVSQMIYDYQGVPTYSLVHIDYPILSQKEFERVVIMHPKRYIKTMWQNLTQARMPIKHFVFQVTPPVQVIKNYPILRLEDITLNFPAKAELCLISSAYLQRVYALDYKYYN
jgi:hypothetical protein